MSDFFTDISEGKVRAVKRQDYKFYSKNSIFFTNIEWHLYTYPLSDQQFLGKVCYAMDITQEQIKKHLENICITAIFSNSNIKGEN